MKEGRNYNNTHPEMEEGEMFLTNCVRADYDYARIGWKTKRRGLQSYTVSGEALKGYAPVFVKKEEYDKGMRKYEIEE